MQTFDLDMFPGASFVMYPAGTSVLSPNTLNSIGQEADWSGGGYWAGEMDNIRVSKRAQHLAWRAFAWNVKGRLNEFVMPYLDDLTKPIGDATLDTMSFSAAADVNLSGTTVHIRVNAGGPIEAGQLFTVDHPTAGPRLYIIGEAGAPSAGVQICTFGPPAREAFLVDTPLDFKDPRCVMKVTTPAKDLWPTVRPPYRADAKVAFVESAKYQTDL